MAITGSTPRKRIREVFPDIVIGRYPTGALNSLTDVPGVLVSTQSIHLPAADSASSSPGSGSGSGLASAPNPRWPHSVVNTGVTTVLPRADWFHTSSPCALFRFNGSGEVTGSHWLAETGRLNSPVVVTSSLSVGACYDGVYHYAVREYAGAGDAEGKGKGLVDWFLLPVIAETYDGFLSDVACMPVTPGMVVAGIEDALGGRGEGGGEWKGRAVEEGCTGGGTGMMCQGFKAGTGSASRVIKGWVRSAGAGDGEGEGEQRTYTLGALVQSNFGAQWDLHIGRVPVGKLMMDPDRRRAWEKNLHPENPGSGSPPEDLPQAASTSTSTSKSKEEASKDGSIIVVLATDAPLSSQQLERLAKRATVGLARVGGWGSNTSGDVFLAFSTAESLASPREPGRSFEVRIERRAEVVHDQCLNGLFECAADAVEEAIYNSLCMARTTVGPEGLVAKEIDLGVLAELLERYYVR